MVGLKDVADRAGVSASTVSRVLAGKSYVSETTRSRVWAAVEALNYRPNVLAQSLKTGSSNTLALIIPSIQNQMFPHLTRGAEDAAREAGYTLVLCNTDEDMALERQYIESLRSLLAAGFICGTMLPDSEHLRELHRDGVPLVLSSRYYGDAIDAVLIDNEKAGYQATKHLIDTGCKHIAIAVGDRNLSIYAERMAGYRSALAEARLEQSDEMVLADADDKEKLYQDVTNLLRERPETDAVFATNDQKAFVVMRAIHDLGLRIPEDVSIIGLDDVEMSRYMEPPLTTVAQPLYELGRRAVLRILELIRYKEEHGSLPAAKIEILDTKLKIRGSTKEEL